jgi:hypothetical protein
LFLGLLLPMNPFFQVIIASHGKSARKFRISAVGLETMRSAVRSPRGIAKQPIEQALLRLFRLPQFPFKSPQGGS